MLNVSVWVPRNIVSETGHPRRFRSAGRFQFKLFLDPRQTGHDQRGESQIGIEVRAAHAALDPHRVRAFAADPEAGGAVVDTPHRPGRRERAGLKTFIGVDVWCQKISDFARVPKLAREKLPHDGRHPVRRGRIGEKRYRTVNIPQ